MTSHHDAASLLQAIDHLPHSARIQHTLRAAAQLDDATRAQLTASLYAQPDASSRHLATLIAAAHRDLDTLRRAAQEDPSLSLRGLSIKHLIRLDPDAPQLAITILDTLPSSLTPIALTACLRHRRADIAQRLIPALHIRDRSKDAARLLSLLPPEELTHKLPSLKHFAPWKHLTKHHLALCAQHLSQELDEVTNAWQTSWILSTTHRTTIIALAKHDPDTLWSLVETHLSQAHLRHALLPLLAKLLRLDPRRTAQWLLHPQRHDWLRFAIANLSRKNLRALHPDDLPSILQRLLPNDEDKLAKLLRSHPPQLRAHLFNALTDHQEHRWQPQTLHVLPAALRHQLAQRLLNRRATQEDLTTRCEMQGFLPYEAAHAALQPTLRSAEADERALATAHLIHAARRDGPGHLATCLATLAPRLKNEQDPVRATALGAITQISPHKLTDDTLPHLLTLTHDALNARDTSYLTRNHLAHIAHKLLLQATSRRDLLLRPQLDASLSILSQLAGHQGTLSLPYKLRYLPRGAERHLLDALLPWLRASADRLLFNEAINLANILDKRAYHLDDLQEILGEAALAHDAPNHSRSSAIHAWLADPSTRDARIEALLKHRRSNVKEDRVWRHLHTRRQDLLDPFIQGGPLKENAKKQKVAWLFPATDGFHRWLPRQQRTFAALLYRVIQDKTQAVTTRTHAVHTLARMTIHAPSDLAPLLTSAEIPIAEAAMGAIIWCDAPSGSLELLLEHVDGDRARVAMYAVGRLARCLSPDELLNSLRTLLQRERLKVTVFKEALRLLPACGERGNELLSQVWARPDLHRDVRIAATHAARSSLHFESSWRLLEEITRGEEPYSARSLVQASPQWISAEHHARYAALLMELAKHRDAEVRSQLFATLANTAWSPSGWMRHVATSLPSAAREAALNLGEVKGWYHALRCLVLATNMSGELDELERCAGELIEAAARELEEPRLPINERDRPATQRLIGLVNQLTAHASATIVKLRPALVRIADKLDAEAPLLCAESMRLRRASIQLDEADAAQRLLEALDRLPTAAVLRSDALDALATALDSYPNASADERPAELNLTLMRRLVGDERVAARELAAWLIERWGESWSGAWIKLLDALRRDPSIEVRARVARVFVYEESMS
jgi:hypothetical protein